MSSATVCGVFHDKHVQSNVEMFYFHMNLHFVYIMVMVASVFRGIAENVLCESASAIVILAKHLDCSMFCHWIHVLVTSCLQ